MTTVLGTPTVDRLPEVDAALRAWQLPGAPLQLHPGDLGWFQRFGSRATAAAVRTWRRDDRLAAVGLLDGSTLLRVALAPDLLEDVAFARVVADDASRPERGVLPAGEAAVEAPPGSALHDVLGERGWALDEPWTLLRRDLTEPVEEPAGRVEVVAPEDGAVWTGVNRSAFGGTAPTGDEAGQRWRAMLEGSAAAHACFLVLRDEDAVAVAAAGAWSAGPGRDGVLEPVGTHRDHRGRGHGRAVALAAAATLRELGCAGAVVATESANEAAVATYVSAGFAVVGERRDRCRDGS